MNDQDMQAGAVQVSFDGLDRPPLEGAPDFVKAFAASGKMLLLSRILEIHADIVLGVIALRCGIIESPTSELLVETRLAAFRERFDLSAPQRVLALRIVRSTGAKPGTEVAALSPGPHFERRAS